MAARSSATPRHPVQQRRRRARPPPTSVTGHRPRMSDKAHLAAVLDELCSAVGADAGGAFYIDDGDGLLRLAAATDRASIGKGPGLMSRLRGSSAVGQSAAEDGETLILDVP